MFQKERFGGFPSGQWLKCINPDVIAKHQSKVYGKASVGAPPMSVPHIDSRMINGENSCYLACLFFQPDLKNGSYSDLPLSIKPDNIFPMLSAGIKKYTVD
jgi:malate dehydrogenase (quinone)